MPPRTHGLSSTKEYHIWEGIIQRCTNPKVGIYKYYGGRGIKICDRWRSFEDFIIDMGPMPKPGCSVERIDTNRDYEPLNCKWETDFYRQARNRKDSWRTADGIPVIDICDAVGIPYSVVSQRVNKLGWSLDLAFSTPPRADKRRRPMPSMTKDAGGTVHITCPCCGNDIDTGMPAKRSSH